jgi:CheY-like chemotaxis protein
MNKRVLIVEDDELVADRLANLVRVELGCVPFVTKAARRALDLFDPRCDFCFLDIKVADGGAFTLATRLRERGVPFVFVSATDPAEIPADLATVPFLRKPVMPPRLLEVARQYL